MFYPIFWGCKYTNKIRIINNNPVFQHIILLITFMAAAVRGSCRQEGPSGNVHLEEHGSRKRSGSTRRRRAVTVLVYYSSQLRAETAIPGNFWQSCVTFPLKTATARQITTAKRTQTDAFTYLCMKIHAFRERCGERTKRKNV